MVGVERGSNATFYIVFNKLRSGYVNAYELQNFDAAKPNDTKSNSVFLGFRRWTVQQKKMLSTLPLRLLFFLMEGQGK